MFSSIRIAIRSLAKRRAAAGAAIVSLAVGLGVNSSVFSVVDALYLRPPAVQEPETLVEIAGHFRDSGSAVLDWADYQEIAAQVPAFSEVSAYMGRGGLWRNGDDTTLLLVDAISDNYLKMLGIQPYLGRFETAESNEGDPPVFLTYWLWKERLGGRPEVIGERIEFRDHTWRIAAVLPPQFRGLSATGQRHIWIPMSSWSRYFRGDTNRGSGQFAVVGRLKPGVSLEQAQTQLDTLETRLEGADSRIPKGRRLVADSIGREVGPGLLILAAVGLVLLAACANVAAMLLAHAEARRREIGLRLSLGAGWWALAKQFLTESLVLVVPGAVGGVLLATWILSVAPALAPPAPVPLHFDFRIDLRLLLFTCGCVLFTVLAFGLSPLSYALRVSLVEGRTSSRDSRFALIRPAMVSLQVAMSVVLVAAAIVLGRAFADSSAIYPGYDASRPLALLSASVTSQAGNARLFNEATERMKAASGGVESVTYARHIPLTGSGAGATMTVTPEGLAPDQPAPRIYFNLVGPDFFEVVGAHLSSGRTFGVADHAPGSAPVAIVNAEAARRFWPGQSALGKTLRARSGDYEVVGVAADGRIGSLHEAAAPVVFLPAFRVDWGETVLIARTRPGVDPGSIVRELARAAGQTPGLRVYQSTTLRSIVDQALHGDWVPTVFGGALAILGVLLAAGGLYGAISFVTEQRLSEFGVRMAIGAQTSEIAGLVFRQAARYCAAGVPLGILVFVAGQRYFSASLLHNRPVDPMAVATGTLVAILVVQLGAILPALRAARLDPMEVLRGE
jgi:putative ABC transport system permease protein